MQLLLFSFVFQKFNYIAIFQVLLRFSIRITFFFSFLSENEGSHVILAYFSLNHDLFLLFTVIIHNWYHVAYIPNLIFTFRTYTM